MKHLIYLTAFSILMFSNSVRADSPAVGLASDYHAVRSVDTALTALFALGETDDIQAYFIFANQDVNNTGTTFGISAAYKHLVSGSDDGGFHLGAGLGFGTFPKDKSFVHVNGIAGFRFSVARQVLVHVDGGLSAGTADGKTEIMIGGNSLLFGLTLAYQL